MKTIRWGIIGCGDVTEKKSGPGFAKADGSELAAVMRRDAAKAADYARRHRVPRWYSDADQLTSDKDVDAVYIATPPAFHPEYTVRAARAGKPVYVEKPMALNSRECERMIAVCREQGVPLFVAYYRRALPRFLKIKELVDSGVIGDIRAVQIVLHTPPDPRDYQFRDSGKNSGHWRVDPSVSGGGYFMDMATHTIDFLDYVLGPMEEVCGTAANQAGLYPAEDSVAAAFRFRSGVSGTGSWSFSVYEDRDTTILSGTKGILTFPSFRDGPITVETKNGTEEFLIPHPPHVQQPLIQTVVDELLGRGKCPSTGESALRTAHFTDTVLGGYYES